MSDYERHNGTLIRINPNEGESFDDMLLRVLKENKIDVVESKDNLTKYFIDELWETHYIHNGVLYKIDNTECDDSSDIYEARINPNGNISYTLRFYNGGCSFGEALDTALEINEI